MSSPQPNTVTGADGASITSTAHGGHVLGWSPAEPSTDRLFLSDTASFAPGAAIRGGVPVIFPQFADRGPLGKHGFARNAEWDATSADPYTDDFRLHSDAARCAHTLSNTPETMARWDHTFRLVVIAEAAGSELAVHLIVHNTDSAPFTFTAALHTYLAVSDVTHATVRGLEDAPFIDTAADGERCEPTGQPIVFGSEVDRIYAPAPDAESPRLRHVSLAGPDGTMQVTSRDCSNTVVWNPGPTLGETIGDLQPGGWQRFVCVEAGEILEPRTLAPREKWVGTQHLTWTPA